MPLRPRSNALTRSTGPNLAGDQFTGEIERGFLARMLRVEVRRFVLLVVHAITIPKNAEIIGMRREISQRPNARVSARLLRPDRPPTATDAC